MVLDDPPDANQLAMMLAWFGLAALRVGVEIAREARAVAYQQVIIASMIEFLATVLAGVLLATVVWHAVRITRPGWIEPARRNSRPS